MLILFKTLVGWVMNKSILLTSALVLGSCLSAHAADYADPAAPSSSLFSELRMGVLAHDVDRREKNTISIQAEALFQPLGEINENSTFLDMLFAPRPHIGASVNSKGKTSYGYAGLSWLYPIFGPVFIETSFGGAVHNGNLKNTDPKMEPLGTRVLFRETASIGFDYDQWRIMATVEHLSNAGLGSWNHGLTHVGGRVGYKF
jgi:hypothetical protein